MLANGTFGWRGATPCTGFIPYQAIAAEFGHHKITTQIAEISVPAPLSGGYWVTHMLRCRRRSGRRTRGTVFSSSKAKQTPKVPTTSSAL
jgi:hypothetical protein